jgi:hypothetical protein
MCWIPSSRFQDTKVMFEAKVLRRFSALPLKRPWSLDVTCTMAAPKPGAG